jgi:hypothetical protein
MEVNRKFLIARLLPVLLLVVAAGFWFADVQQGGPSAGRWVVRSLVPLLALVLLSWLTLYRGNGRWSGAGMRMPLGTLGFAIPTFGLTAYLHYAYSINLNDMFGDAEYPDRVFRYLPVYTFVAGGVGFAIGWIAGRNA